MGFQPNSYEPCVANKEIDGSQMIITWHVDDYKVLHKNPRRIDEVAEKLKQMPRLFRKGKTQNIHERVHRQDHR